MSEKIKTSGSQETHNLGKKIARRLNGGEVLSLSGDLGGGKTTLVKGLAQSLGIKETVNSPTFNIIKRYQTPGKLWLYHIDAYRLNSGQELLDLGFAEIITDSQNITVIEWGERVKEVLPAATTWLRFKYLDKNKREIDVETPDS